jgi:SAM-dependent methyltransferase
MGEPQFVGVPRVFERAKIVTLGWEKMYVVCCAQCGFYYVDPMPIWSGDTLQTLYDEEYFGEESMWWHRQRTEVDPQRRLDAIEREREKGSAPRFLDIGCGQGYVLEHALRRGWNVCGLEPSHVWVEQTAARLGVPIWEQRVEEADLPAGSCDVVFSDSVIEHLANPMAMMKLAQRVLKPGGLFYLVTPNAEALVNRIRGLLFHFASSHRASFIEPLCSPYHIVGFTPHSLSVLADRAGFEVRRLWVRHGREEWRKEKRWTASKFKSLALLPVLTLGEILGRGTTIDVLLVRQ